MENKLHNLNGQRGVTITEMLIVLLIIAIVASLALMSMSTSDTRFKRQNVSRELKVAFERARFDSVKRHADGPTAGGTPMPATVVVDTNSYTLNTDTNRDGTYETQVTNFASDITIAPYVAAGDPAFTLPLTVSFDNRGEVSAPGNAKPRFYICNGTCPSTPTTADADLILVTPTGTVNLLGGSSTPPTFSNPVVTSVNASSNISSTVRLP